MKNTFLLIITGALAGFGLAPSSNAQSSDALIDKLVEKGILNVKEANALREDADKDFNKAYSVKSGMPDWVQALKFNGDLRLRYDGIFTDNPAFVDRNRFRYRLRFGAVAAMTDNLEIGMRLISGEKNSGFDSNDPISGNATFNDNASKKLIGIDLVYGKWSPLNTPHWTAAFTGGKMENPFVVSDIVFDPDYTPEGLGEQFGYSINDKHALRLNLGQFVLDEFSSKAEDPFLTGAQIRWDALWTPKIQTTLGLSGYMISGTETLTSANVPDIGRGNTRNAKGALVNDFNPVVVDVSATYNLDSAPYYTGAFPIRVGGTYLNNPAAKNKNTASEVGITFGKAGKRNTWEIGYRYKTLEADSWYEELVDSDTGAFYQKAPPGGSSGYGPGTNLRGHWIRAAWSPYDALTFSATCYLFSLIDEVPRGSDSAARRVQVDASWKF
jgi:hypothetical protein